MRTVEPGAGSWASTLRYRPQEKRWYLATGVFQRYRPGSDERIFPRGFYVYTDNIWDDNAWSDPVYFDNPGFDQDLFWDDDGKVYLSTTVRVANRQPGSKLKDFGIHISEIELNTGRTLTPPRLIRESPYGIAEGSHILRRGAYYYLFTAEGGTEAGHQEWVFRSREGVYGPWEAQGKPLWYNGPNEEVQRTGHADVFNDGHGNWWAVLLGVRPVKDESGDYLEPQMGRESFLVKVEWIDDWPISNEGRNITLTTAGREPIEQAIAHIKPRDIRWRADLGRQSLELGWYQKNTPLKNCYSLTERPGYLRLYGNCYDLASPESPAMLLRKQSSYTESFEAKMEFNPRKAGYEAGVVVWWSQYSYATYGLTLRERVDGEQVLTIASRVPTGKPGAIALHYPNVEPCGENDDIAHKILPGDTVQFRIEATPTTYGLSFKLRNHGSSCRIQARDLTVIPPIGGAFSGVMFGVYAFGQGEPVLDPTDFFDIIIKAT
ncbi:glycoside hydrolase family 43 protein [Nemania serpens]|nr:glycoside hydrolase family 43 protein [Nemania serpens]